MGDIKNIIETVRKFLFSKANREFLTFLFFLAFATVFWFMSTLNETYEQEVEIPIHYTNIPNNVVLTSDDTDTIKATLSDKGLVLMSYLYGGAMPAIQVDFRKYATGSESGTIPAADLQQLVAAKLEASTKIIAITPEEETFFFNYGLSKRVPVRWTGHVRPQQPYFIAEERIVPDSVDVYASQHQLDRISAVYTEALNCEGFSDSLEVSAQLQRTRGVKAIPGNVRITFTTDILTEGSFEGITVRGINVPAGKVLRTFPSKVKVNFVAGIQRLKHLKAADFEVVVDYNEIATNPSQRCRFHLTKIPAGVKRAALDITEADYLIEE